MSCAISSGILPLASFLRSQPSQQQCPAPGATDPRRTGSSVGAGRAMEALLCKRQPHLTRAGPVQLPMPARGPQSVLLGQPCCTPSHGIPLAPPPWSWQSCWRQPHWQSPHLPPAQGPAPCPRHKAKNSPTDQPVPRVQGSWHHTTTAASRSTGLQEAAWQQRCVLPVALRWQAGTQPLA